MKLVQILLPTSDNEGKPFSQGELKTVQAELVEKFGGVTAFLNSPGHGLWKDEDHSEVVRDEVALFEVMAETLERDWWQSYKQLLEKRFQQDVVVIRIQTIEMLDAL